MTIRVEQRPGLARELAEATVEVFTAEQKPHLAGERIGTFVTL